MAKLSMVQESNPANPRLFQPDPLHEVMRLEIRRSLEKILGEELRAALLADSYERTEGRTGYRNGSKPRTLSTSLGPTPFNVPRARLECADGAEEEWHSTFLRRYKRRQKAVDDAILGIYLSGANTRRIRGALRPLLKGTPLSKSAVSRLIGSLKEAFEEWRTRSLKDLDVVYLYADGVGVAVRIGGRVVRMPLLGVIGVLRSGEKILLAIGMRKSESEEAWRGVIEDLSRRDLKRPRLAIIDGNDGLRKALLDTWPGIDIQRCTVHKLRNLLSHAPAHMEEEVTTDYHAIVYAPTLKAAQAAWEHFVKKWEKRGEGVVKSLLEGGDELLTFFRYPQEQWKSLKTTNVIERVNEEFRRRIKTQASLPNETSVNVIWFGLFASGQIRMRKIDGWEAMAKLGDPLETGGIPAQEAA